MKYLENGKTWMKTLDTNNTGSNNIEEHKIRIFYGDKCPLRRIHNLKRNDLCYCGSKIKYKRCCYERDNLQGTHYYIKSKKIERNENE